MYPWIRLFKVVALNLIHHTRRGPLDESVLTFRVWPGDLDFNLHMNDGRYITLTNFGRVDLLGGLGLTWKMIRRGWAPVVASAHVEYRRELRTFQKFRIRTRVLGWDEKWLYIEHRIERGEKLVSLALLKGGLRDHNGMVPPRVVLETLGHSPQSPPVAASLRTLLADDAALPTSPRHH